MWPARRSEGSFSSFASPAVQARPAGRPPPRPGGPLSAGAAPRGTIGTRRDDADWNRIGRASRRAAAARSPRPPRRIRRSRTRASKSRVRHAIEQAYGGRLTASCPFSDAEVNSAGRIAFSVAGSSPIRQEERSDDGKIVTPKTPIRGMGAYARIADTEGNIVGLFESQL
jgi:predicted enzyme related to lactoylglutathione lyase